LAKLNSVDREVDHLSFKTRRARSILSESASALGKRHHHEKESEAGSMEASTHWRSSLEKRLFKGITDGC
jgi:hypothetical protein